MAMLEGKKYLRIYLWIEKFFVYCFQYFMDIVFCQYCPNFWNFRIFMFVKSSKADKEKKMPKGVFKKSKLCFLNKCNGVYLKTQTRVLLILTHLKQLYDPWYF